MQTEKSPEGDFSVNAIKIQLCAILELTLLLRFEIRRNQREEFLTLDTHREELRS